MKHPVEVMPSNYTHIIVESVCKMKVFLL